MAYKNNHHGADYEREVELPTLIDMVFLLLIFFIATLTLSTSGEKKPVPTDQQKEFELPKAKGRIIQEEDKHLTNLLFQFENKVQNDSVYGRVLYVLRPDHVVKKTEAELYSAIKDSLESEPADSSLFATFPPDFLSMSYTQQDTCRAFRLIQEHIRSYWSERFANAGPNLSNTIEIRATKETEFRIISYIMQQCSQFDDDIPKVTFRVMAPDDMVESEGG